MVAIDRSLIEENLVRKGFRREDSHHRYFYHEHEGRETGAYAYTSHGSQYKVYGPSLISRMKRTLRLETNREVIDLMECPQTGEGYVELLRRRGVL